MSRIGRAPIEIPSGVEVSVSGRHVTVKGSNGTLEMDHHPHVTVKVDGGSVLVERSTDQREHRSLHGLTRSLIANMVEGASKGFTKELEIQGVGYRAAMKGQSLEVQAGYSHPVLLDPPQGVKIEVPQPTRIVVSGADKQVVGQVAANIRSIRPPEPYKGKGIRYVGEYVRRKAGKAAK